MATVTPKLYFCDKSHSQIPVWEIITQGGKCFYYERLHHEGHLPIGVSSSFKLGDSTILTIDVVKCQHLGSITILKEKDGYVAPMSWYEKISENRTTHLQTKPSPINV